MDPAKFHPGYLATKNLRGSTQIRNCLTLRVLLLAKELFKTTAVDTAFAKKMNGAKGRLQSFVTMFFSILEITIISYYITRRPKFDKRYINPNQCQLNFAQLINSCS